MKILSVFMVTGVLVMVFAAICVFQPGLDDYIELYDWKRVHFVNRGETLWDIASEFSGDEYDTRLVVAAIKEVNGIGAILKINQKLILPAY
jgi:nucleoid-associated protein YgaU